MMIGVKDKEVRYYLNSNGEFVIENYNSSKPFANFFPGIAGKYGMPMWVFYVNRAQAIASFGTKDKDHAILEFFPANKSWQLVSLQGFRTFIKEFSSKKIIFYEPFHNGFANLGFNINNGMYITPYNLRLEEDNLSLGLKINVEYFTIPNDSYAGLVRMVTIKNTAGASKKLQILDGLPQIVPYGVTYLFLKKLGRTIEAWMKVENLQNNVPFYKLDVDPKDRPEVIHIKEGNFYLAFHHAENKPQLIKPIVDPQQIFGSVTDFSLPYRFLATKKFSYPKKEINQSKMLSGFLLLNLELSKNQDKTFYSIIGYMRSREILNATIKKIIKPEYLIQKRQENKKIIEELQKDIITVSSCKEFDLYAQQTYLDNIIRGGYPVTLTPPLPRPCTQERGLHAGPGFKSDTQQTVFYLYARKHGDLERDYNKFQLQPTYFSQGNGNYRDMNQNRRCDVWFNPDIKDENLITFFNLLQADGFNPLVVKGVTFELKAPKGFKVILKGLVNQKDISKIISFLSKPFTPPLHAGAGFTPGEVILFIEENKIKLKVSYDEFLNILLSHSLKIQEAQPGKGFWTDHWTYNLDLLESYLGIYPEKLKEIVFDKRVFTFYDNIETVKPRREKYLLMDGGLRQLHSVIADNIKIEMIGKRKNLAYVVRTEYGKGRIYYTTLINKLLCLLVNKLASLDPSGIGIEMEADRPNWFDALNGLPGLFGSSSCETFELKRLVLFIKMVLEKTKVEKIDITEEVFNFLIGLNGLLNEYLNNNSPNRDYQYWDKSYSLKEVYREKTGFGFSGRELEIKTSRLIAILDKALEKVNSGINKAKDKKRNIYYTYFINEVREFKIFKPHFIKPTKFIQKKLPFFLEGQVHALKLEDNLNKARALYKSTKLSQLYDRKLKMYKVTAPLKSQPEEIGRCRSFTPGWLENESIWLHMEYKYLLELLNKGLYKEFYQEFKNVLIPFQKPENYGRSILENSSFLVSSVFPDKNLHGNGFVARLSGSTAEFLQIWLTMNLGTGPFFLNEQNELNLRFQPILAGWLFDKKGNYSFNFLSKICIIYHNPKRKDTFGKNAVMPKRIIFKDRDKNSVELSSRRVPSPFAEQIRSRLINKIDIYLS